MKNQVVSITPEMTKSMLKANVGNRTLRRTVVQSLKASFARGEYIQTHQRESVVSCEGLHRCLPKDCESMQSG